MSLGLIAEINASKKIRQEIYEILKVQSLDENHHVSQFNLASPNLYCISHITSCIIYFTLHCVLSCIMYCTFHYVSSDCNFPVSLSLLLIALESKHCLSNNSILFLSKIYHPSVIQTNEL